MTLLAVVQLVAIQLLSLGPGDTVATSAPKRVRRGEEVTLVVALQSRDGRLFAGAPWVDLGQGPRAAEPWRGPLPIEWFKIEPAVGSVDNERGGFHWEPIPYAETPWPGAAARDGVGLNFLARAADVRSTTLGDRGGLGTMAFQARVGTLSTPGAESRWRGGLSDRVHRVTVRAGDSFLGYLTELFNTPYIWASAGDGPVHQAERLIGSDCADFVAYGLRRAGARIEYGSTLDVPRWGRRVASVAAKDLHGRFVDGAGAPVRGVREGDLLLFHRHVAALSEDRAPLGVLDANDLILHTAWAPPAEESFDAAAAWTRTPFTVWRIALQ